MANDEQSAEAICAAVVDLPPEQRSAYLERACGGSRELRSAVEQRLREHERGGGSHADSAYGLDSPTVVAGPWIHYDGMIGKQFGRYTIVELLGAGGMGAVFRARDERLERAVAIKILARGLLMGEEARRRFHKEALALAKLSHAHIAAVYDVGEQDGIDYIVMECVPGESLAAKLKSGALSLKDATGVTQQIAEALEEAHEHGIVHRDLKPANVMVTPKGQVKVLDFGLAKLIAGGEEERTLSLETGGLVGTPLYMSPEQAEGKQIDTRTDLWALGVIYYEALSAHAPFGADSSLAVMRAITEEQPKPIQQLCPGIPASVERIVARALKKDPDSRYQSAAEVIRDTSLLLAELSGTGAAEKTTPKRQFRAAAMAALIALLVASAAGFWIYHRASKKQWARDEAPEQIRSLLAARKPLAAFLVLNDAERYLPGDPQLEQISGEQTMPASITSSPSGRNRRDAGLHRAGHGLAPRGDDSDGSRPHSQGALSLESNQGGSRGIDHRRP